MGVLAIFVLGMFCNLLLTFSIGGTFGSVVLMVSIISAAIVGFLVTRLGFDIDHILGDMIDKTRSLIVDREWKQLQTAVESLGVRLWLRFGFAALVSVPLRLFGFTAKNVVLIFIAQSILSIVFWLLTDVRRYHDQRKQGEAAT